MKYLRRLVYGTAMGAALLAGCNKKSLQELNIDPQSATTIDVNFLLTSAQLGAASGGSQGDNRYIDWRTNIGMTSTAMQQLAAVGGITNNGDKYFDYIEGYTAPWDFIYRDLRNLGEIVKQTGPGGFAEGQNNSTRQAARILRAFLYHRLTDYYGSVPYSDALQGTSGTFFPHYDKQKTIYTDLLKELDEASAGFTALPDPGFKAADLYYNGDVAKWKRWGYSLMLRLAMRISKVDQATANTYVQKAVAGGVFQSNDDNVLVPMEDKFLWNSQNGISRAMIPDDGGEIKTAFLSKTLVDFLKGPSLAVAADDDPRLMILSGGIYNWPSEANYTPVNVDPLGQKGMPNGYDIDGLKTLENNPNLDPIATYSRMNPKLLQRSESYMLMNYGEVELLLAEAAERGIGGVTGGAAHYAAGVKASMQMYPVYDASFAVSDAQVATALAARPYGIDKPALEMIGTQLWLNHFMNWWEAWSEWRRTGFPTLTQVNYPGNQTGGTIYAKLKYPSSEVAGNPNFSGASKNDYTTKVWWAGGPE